MISITNFYLPPELDKIVESYYYINDWVLDFTKRYIGEIFGENIIKYLNINEIVKDAIPKIEKFINNIKMNMKINELPWNIDIDLDVLNKYQDSWYIIHTTLIELDDTHPRLNYFNLTVLYPLLNIIKTEVSEEQDEDLLYIINNKYVKELISSFYK